MNAGPPPPATTQVRAAAAAVLLALLAGCASGPDFTRPDPPGLLRYTAEPLQIERTGQGTAAGDAAAQRLLVGVALDRPWWQLFHSAAIDGVVQRALAGNRTLAAAAATLEQAQELARAQAGTRSPQVGVTAGSGRQKYGAEFLGTLTKPPPFSYFAAGPGVSYTVDVAGGESRAVEQQRALAEVRRQQLAAAGLAVTGNAVTQALRVAALRAQIATVEAMLDRDRENLQLVRVALDAGSVSRLDIVAAESQLAGDTTLLPPLRQQLAGARHALAVVLGDAPAAALLPEFDLAELTLPAELPVSLPSELARRRPDILAAEAQLHAATAAVGIATANLYPHLTLSASTGQQAVAFGRLFDRSSGVFGLAGGLTAPLFDGGTLRAEQRASVAALQARSAQYEQTVLEAFGQVADALQALDQGAEQLQAQSRAQQAAQQNVDLTRSSYREGNAGVLQVLDAERRYQQARLGVVQAQAQRLLDTVQLYLALGGGGTGG